MPEPAAPLPYPGTTTPARSSPDGAVPPMPSEVSNARPERPAAAGRWRAAMMPLRRMMRRTPAGAD
jgi:hypothetical protein